MTQSIARMQFTIPNGLGVALSWMMIAAISIISFRIIYNVYLHPLRKFPGPWLAKATPLPFTWRLLNGRMVEWTSRLHEEYGDVVRIQPDELSFTLAQAWTDIFACRPQLPKPEKGTIVPPNGVRFFATLPDPEDHGKHRRILSHAFSDRALKEQEFILQNYTDFYIKRLRDQIDIGSDIDICNWNMFLMFDIICDLCFAESFNSLENAAYHPWVATIFKGFKQAQILTSFSLFPPLDTIVELSMPRFIKEKIQEHFQYTRSQVDRRVGRETDRPDIMKFLLENNYKNGMTRDEIDSNMQFLLLAGSETSAHTITGAVWYSLPNSEAMERLQREIRSSFERASDISIASVSQLEYLDAVLKEALLLHHPGPVSVPRLVDRPVEIAGHMVPRGARVGIPHGTAYKRDSNFLDPECFRPERWLPEGNSKYSNDNKAIFEPFMVGPRNCLGKRLAWAEMKLALSKLIWAFDIELSKNNADDWADQKVFLMPEKKALNVMLRTTYLP